MLGSNEAIATVAVHDLERARRFYSETLGLEPIPVEEPVLSYRCGTSRLLVYASKHAGATAATAVTWAVEGDLDALVEELRGRGVVFEHYEFPGGRLNGDIHELGSVRNAWFKDPEGNIHSVVAPAR